MSGHNKSNFGLGEVREIIFDGGMSVCGPGGGCVQFVDGGCALEAAEGLRIKIIDGFTKKWGAINGTERAYEFFSKLRL